MSKFASDNVLDGTLDRIAATTRLRVCAGQPSSYADAITRTLASVVVDSGDFSKANGDTNGRKVTVAQQSAISITASGSADHIVLTKEDQSPSLLQYGTTCTTQALTSGGTVTVPAWDAEIADPA
jgi:hypothetical protein